MRILITILLLLISSSACAPRSDPSSPTVIDTPTNDQRTTEASRPRQIEQQKFLTLKKGTGTDEPVIAGAFGCYVHIAYASRYAYHENLMMSLIDPGGSLARLDPSKATDLASSHLFLRVLVKNTSLSSHRIPLFRMRDTNGAIHEPVALTHPDILNPYIRLNPDKAKLGYLIFDLQMSEAAKYTLLVVPEDEHDSIALIPIEFEWTDHLIEPSKRED